MAEAAGLVVGVVGLAGIFNNAVDCFEFVQLGRTFGKDFQRSQLKLDSARLRLSRWGKSLGLDQDLQNTTSLQPDLRSNPDVEQAERLLGQILGNFADAEHISARYRDQTDPNSASLAVYDPKTDLEPVGIKLHEQMRQLAMERQRGSSLRTKAKWALYQERHFRRLIDDISEDVESLVNLFPATEKIRRELCDAEVAAVGDSESLSLLKEIAATDDKLLEQAINKAATGEATTSYHNDFSGSHNSGVQLGHNAGSMTFTLGSK